MKFLIMLLSVLTFVGCASSFKRQPSAEPKAGDTYQIKFDPSAAFQDSGEKLVIGVDWNRVWSILSNQTAKDNAVFCSEQLESAYRNFNSINTMAAKGGLNQEQADLHRTMATNSLQAKLGLCEGLVGEAKAQSINAKVIESLKQQ